VCKSCLWYCREFFGEGQIFGFIGIIITQNHRFDFPLNFLKLQNSNNDAFVLIIKFLTNLMNYLSIDYLILYAFLVVILVIGLKASRGIKNIYDYAIVNAKYGAIMLVITLFSY